eukprot:s4375_g4.t1
MLDVVETKSWTDGGLIPPHSPGNDALTNADNVFEICKSGIPSTPDEFVQRALQAGHPRDLMDQVCEIFKEAILSNFHRPPHVVVKERVEFLKKYTKLASELKAEELKLRFVASLAPVSATFMVFVLLGNERPLPAHLCALLRESGCDVAQLRSETQRTPASFLNEDVALAAIQSFLKIGFPLNFSHRKIDAVIPFRGDDARRHRRNLLVECFGRLVLPQSSTVLRCVATYEHLGTVSDADGSISREVAHRKNRAVQVFRQVGTSILRNRHVSIATPLKLFESLIIPVLLRGAGNWGLLSTRAFNNLAACEISWQRSIINDGFWTDDQHIDYELYSVHGNCHPWLPELPEPDSCMLSTAFVMAPASEDFMIEWLTAHKHDGAAAVKRLYKKALMQHGVLGDAVSLHKQLKQTFVQGGATFQDIAAAPAVASDGLFPCDWCPHQFDSRQKLQVRMLILGLAMAPGDHAGPELSQSLVGTGFLFHSLPVEAELVFSGAGSITEHATEHELTCGVIRSFNFYLDDGVIAGDVASVGAALAHIQAQSAALGLHLNLDKSEVICLGADGANLAAHLPQGLLLDRDGNDRVQANFELLGAAVGDDAFVAAHTQTRAASCKVGAAADSYSEVKANHLNTAQRFQPLVVESTGAWSRPAAHTLQLFARATAAREGEDAAACFTQLLQELCVTVRRFRARAVLRRRAELASPTDADVVRPAAALLLATDPAQ